MTHGSSSFGEGDRCSVGTISLATSISGDNDWTGETVLDDAMLGRSIIHDKKLINILLHNVNFKK